MGLRIRDSLTSRVPSQPEISGSGRCGFAPSLPGPEFWLLEARF